MSGENLNNSNYPNGEENDTYDLWSSMLLDKAASETQQPTSSESQTNSQSAGHSNEEDRSSTYDFWTDRLVNQAAAEAQQQSALPENQADGQPALPPHENPSALPPHESQTALPPRPEMIPLMSDNSSSAINVVNFAEQNPGVIDTPNFAEQNPTAGIQSVREVENFAPQSEERPGSWRYVGENGGFRFVYDDELATQTAANQAQAATDAQIRDILNSKQQGIDDIVAETQAKMKAQEILNQNQQTVDDVVARELAAQKAREEELQKAKERERQMQILKDKERLGQLDDEDAAIDEEIARLRAEEQPEDSNETSPLTVVDANFERDLKDLAHDLAERELNTETSKGNIIKKLWKGTLFKKYYEKAYTREYLEGKRKADVNGESLTAVQLIEKRKDKVIERFVMSVTEESDRFIHKAAGESMKEADAETTDRIKEVVSRFATSKMTNEQFNEEIRRIQAENRDAGKPDYAATFGNYLDVAIQARERATHGIAIEQVMEGFKVYNAEARDGIRTEAHRDNIDKIVNALESTAIGQFIPAEIIAGSVSVASALTQSGLKAVLGAAGGMLASSALAGLKERNRITEDRAQMLRDMANGLEYKSRGKSGKYEKQIAGFNYKIEKASALTARLESAIDNAANNPQELLEAIAAARVRSDFSDENARDLIAYTSEDKRGEERLNLDIALIRAEKSLTADQRVSLVDISSRIQTEIERDVNEKDKDFKKKRAIMATKKAGKTLALGVGTFFASQEIMAALDPNKIGFFEKVGLLKTNNNEDASETILAGLAGPRVRTELSTQTIENVSGDETARIEELESGGFTRVESAPASTEVVKSLDNNIDPSEVNAPNVKLDFWADNGTRPFDSNELRAYLQNGEMVSGMRGVSTSTAGESFDYGELASTNNIKAFFTIGDKRFEAVNHITEDGRLAWGENGFFTTPTGETVKLIGDNGEKLYKYFEIAADHGVDADGVQHIVPLATDIGTNSFAGKMQKVVESVIETPAKYTFTRTITQEVPRAVTTAGIAFAPETARTGLGEARQAEIGTEPTTAPTGTRVNQAPTTPSSIPNQSRVTNPNTQPTPAQTTANQPQAQSQPVNSQAAPQPAQPAPRPAPQPTQSGQALNTPNQAPNQTSSALNQAPNTPSQTPNTPNTPNQTQGQAPNQAPNQAPAPGSEFLSYVEDNRGLISDALANALTASDDQNISINNYSSLWNSLSDADKDFARNFMNNVKNSPDANNISWGSGFRSWFDMMSALNNL